MFKVLSAAPRVSQYRREASLLILNFNILLSLRLTLGEMMKNFDDSTNHLLLLLKLASDLRNSLFVDFMCCRMFASAFVAFLENERTSFI